MKLLGKLNALIEAMKEIIFLSPKVVEELTELDDFLNNI